MASNTVKALKLMFDFSCKRARKLSGERKYKEWEIMGNYSAMIMAQLRRECDEIRQG